LLAVVFDHNVFAGNSNKSEHFIKEIGFIAGYGHTYLKHKGMETVENLVAIETKLSYKFIPNKFRRREYLEKPHF